jgi:hypothetical protein
MTKREVDPSLPVLMAFSPDKKATFLGPHGKVSWAFGTAFLLLTVFLRAQSTLEPSVRSSNQGATVQIQVPASTTLRTLVTKFCESTVISCHGTDIVPDEVVPIMSMKGTWNEIVNELFAGTNLNYVAISPTLSSSGSLFIERSSRLTQLNASTTALFPTNQNSDSGTTASIRNNAEIFDSSSIQEGGGASGSSTEANAVSQPAEYLPFPDSHGRPVPAADKSLGGLPFGDIGARPEDTDATKFLPFPDSHGKAVPARPPQTGSPFQAGHN